MVVGVKTSLFINFTVQQILGDKKIQTQKYYVFWQLWGAESE